MRLAVLSESSADAAAAKILVDGLLGSATAKEPLLRSQARYPGWPGVRDIAAVVLRSLHFGTDADGLVVLADANDSPLHIQSGACNQSRCRICQLEKVLAETAKQLGPRPHRPDVQTAVGLAVPAIEAWYLCAKDPHATEAAWVNRSSPHTKLGLKKLAYGTDRPVLPKLVEVAKQEANRLVKDLNRLERDFPVGFGSLASAVRSWK